MSLGFAQAGLKPLIAADHDQDACLTYEQNIGLKPFHTDLNEPSADFLAAIDAAHDPLALIGGPPCQGFSSAGQKNADDKRNRLIFAYLGLVERLKPKWFLFENVEGLLTSNRGKSVFLLAKKFIELGYLIRIEKVNFASFGLPQGRKRVIILGNRLGVAFQFPIPQFSFNSGKHKNINSLPPGPTLADAIFPLGQASDKMEDAVPYRSPAPENDYDARMRAGSSTFRQHTTTPTQTQAAAIAALKPGQTMQHLPEAYWPKSFKRRAYRRVKDGTPTEKRGGAPSGLKRLQGQLASLTITSAAAREFIHPVFNRPLTYRECARLQSFPDHFNFAGSNQSIATQIGNAFPAMAAQVFAEHIARIDSSFGADRNVTRSGLIDYELTRATAMSPPLAQTDTLLASLSDKQIGFSLLTA